jgi:hypothetical protein
MLIKKSRQRGNMICVATVQGQMQAEIYKTKLETLGIPVLLQYESAGLLFGLTLDGLGEVRVMVPEEFEKDALAALEPEDTPLEDDWQEADDSEAEDAD